MKKTIHVDYSVLKNLSISENFDFTQKHLYTYICFILNILSYHLLLA